MQDGRTSNSWKVDLWIHKALLCFRYSLRWLGERPSLVLQHFLLSDFQLHNIKCTMKAAQTLQFPDESKCARFFKVFVGQWVSKHSKSCCFSIQLTGKSLLCLIWTLIKLLMAIHYFRGNGLSLLVNAKITFFLVKSCHCCKDVLRIGPVNWLQL